MTEINFLNIIQVLIAIALIGFILIQRGPGATAGSAFGGGGGASGTVFGAKGSGSFLTKSTAILATLFFIITMLIAIDASDKFSTVGEAGDQDLGVFGALEETDAEPSVTPVGNDDTATELVNDVITSTQENASELSDAAEQAITEGLQAVEDSTKQAVDAVEEKAEEIKEAAESDDSDGGNK